MSLPPLFGLIGINVFADWNPIVYMDLATILGIFVGKSLLDKISDSTFIIAFKVL
ncbi:MAG: hypothetical protein H8E17_19345 [Deltaproteobacteria bacterium]|nr:hypothetical protein [Deltaproteobacteria bacterium]